MGKYTFDDIVKRFNSKGYEVISKESEYQNVNTKIKYICSKHRDKGVQEIKVTKFNIGHGCYYCGRERTEQAHVVELNKDEDKLLCESKGFEYIDSGRQKGKIGIYFICPKHKDLGIQFMQKYNMKRCKVGCVYCTGHNYPIWYLEEKLKEYPNIEVLEELDGKLSTRLKCRCTVHDIYSNKSLREIFQGKGCIECGKEKLSKQKILSLEEYQTKVNKVNNHIKVLEYNGCFENAKFQCLNCGHIWESHSQSMIQSQSKQCPNCEHFYKGEKAITTFLNSLNIPFISQYRFKDCKDKRELPFDFYLPNNNVCIEYDGEQHFSQRNGWTDLKLIQKHDKIKDEYCLKNNIVLIRIPYWEYENINILLFDKLEHLNIIKKVS